MVFELLILGGFAFLAGLIDAVAGGGGLIQLPALFAVLPETPAATLFGTNKGASIWGTAVAATQYARRVRLPWRMLVPALFGALICGWYGARVVSLVPTTSMRPGVLVALILVAIHTFRRKDLGHHHVPRFIGRHEGWLGLLTGTVLGFYDGIFGPGTGSFLIFIFVRGFGYDFLHASASAKLVNFATNAAALSYFIPHAQILWPIAAVMAIGNISGAMIGSRVALKHGSGFVRLVFLGVVAMLILKLAFDTFA